MKKKTRILNQTATPTAPKNQRINKFWNFINKDDETAELQLFGEISSEESWWNEDCVTYRDFIAELNALGEKKNINVLIQSGGGDVFAANAIYNALILNKATITGTIIGICASAATIILMACDKRKIAKNAILMAHNPSISLWGSYTSEDLLKLADVTDQVKKSIATAYMDRLDKTEEEINQLMDAESWYVGQEAVDAGFCDEVIETGFQDNIFSNRFTVNGVPCSFKNYLEVAVPENIRKKVQALSITPPKDKGTFSNKTIQKGNENMGEESTKNTTPVITDAAHLKSVYPEFVDQIVADAVKAERERLKAIDEIAAGIPGDVLTRAKYDEPISAADLALAQMKANNKSGQQTLNNIVDDLANSGASSVGVTPNAGTGKEDEVKAEKEAKVNGLAAALGKDKRRGKK